MWMSLLALACSDGEIKDSETTDTEEADADADADADSDTDTDADTDVFPPGQATWIVSQPDGDIQVELDSSEKHYLECKRSTDGKDKMSIVLSNTPQTSNATAKVVMVACPYGTGGDFSPPQDATCSEPSLTFSWTGQDATYSADTNSEALNCSVSLSDDGTDLMGTFGCAPLKVSLGDATVGVREGSFTCRMQ
jgi:hypothetical protein